MEFFSFISNRIKEFFISSEKRTRNETDASIFEKKEKVIAFSIALFFAVCLWFIVNMGRDFNVTVNIPIQVVNLPEDLALTTELPEHISVNVAGEGWNLIGLYRNPPNINVNAESDRVNVQEQIRNQIGSFSDLNILQVEPSQLRIETEQKASKKVPINSLINVDLREQHGFTSSPNFDPDSVTITGASSIIEPITSWDTEQVNFDDVNNSIDRNIPLMNPEPGVRVEPSEVRFRINVAEFTEAEVRIPIRTRNLSSGQAISYNPSSITVRFDVPITQYTNVVDIRPFSAYVDYSDIEADTTGMITPTIETDTDLFNVRVRNFQPQRVSYFNIVPG